MLSRGSYIGTCKVARESRDTVRKCSPSSSESLRHNRTDRHAVTLGVEQRRVGADAELAGQHREDAAADPALGGHADRADPVPCRVVHTAGHHDRQGPTHHRGIA